MWKVLALATTFAGNLTILGSVANIIVVESARGHVEVGFWDYAKFGIRSRIEHHSRNVRLVARLALQLVQIDQCLSPSWFSSNEVSPDFDISLPSPGSSRRSSTFP